MNQYNKIVRIVVFLLICIVLPLPPLHYPAWQLKGSFHGLYFNASFVFIYCVLYLLIPSFSLKKLFFVKGFILSIVVGMISYTLMEYLKRPDFEVFLNTDSFQAVLLAPFWTYSWVVGIEIGLMNFIYEKHALLGKARLP